MDPEKLRVLNSMLADISSSEEEHQRKALNKRKTAAVASTAMAAPPPALQIGKRKQIPHTMIPKPHTVAELVAKNVHLNIHQKPRQVCSLVDTKLAQPGKPGKSATAPDAVTKTEEELETQQVQEAAVDPWQVVSFNEMLQSLPRPKYNFRSLDRQFDATHQQLIDSLRQGKVELPLLTAEFESELLAESGTFRHRKGAVVSYPACRRGNECVCMTMGIPGMELTENKTNNTGRFICTAFMYPEEYRNLIYKGVVPRGDRECILCCRYLLSRWITFLRGMDMAGESGTEANFQFQIDPSHVYQLYYNLCDRPMGYYRHCMLIPRPEETLISPICMLNLSLLKVQRDPVTGRRIINQSLLIYQQPVEAVPQLGERMNFF